jgi:hypothetical protein
MPPSTYAAYEDPNKFKKPILPFDLAKRIAGELEQHGITAIEVMRLAGLESPRGWWRRQRRPETLLVTGAVAAGVWREETRWPNDDQYEIEVGPNPVARRRALRGQDGGPQHGQARSCPTASSSACGCNMASSIRCPATW